MKRLRQIVLASLDYSEICEAVVAELPANTVAAIRHWHGDTHTFCYDQRVEWGMEVLHGRGDELATEPDMAGHTSAFPFPANFIEDARRQAGPDRWLGPPHERGWGPA